MRKLYFFALIIVLTSCTKINYVGNSYTPTESVEVYVDEGAIRKKYDVVGKGYLRANGTLSTPEKIQEKAIKKAKQKGADAVLIKDYLVPSTAISTVVRTDTVGKGAVSVANTTLHENPTAGFYVLFLKYTQ